MSAGFSRPGPGEHAEYYGRYVELVPDGSIVDTLIDQLGDTLRLLQEVPPERETFRYAPGKWSIRDVVGHLIDTERVMSYRALSMARADGVDLPGMDQDEWARRSNAGSRALADLSSEWASLRRATVHLFATLDADVALRRGRASGYEFTVRSFPWIIAGHELWHRRGLARDYLGRDA
ncbi:MAG TPA: DinB family protein [Longimicrobiales bacterium]|nr:DinB family protein [Longimicrobiales bacterium]